jgi:hypothetical protein
MFYTPSEDIVDVSERALRKVECDMKIREQRRLELAAQGLLMVAPGRW